MRKVMYRNIEIIIEKGNSGYNAKFIFAGEIETCILNASHSDMARIEAENRIDYLLQKRGDK
jgi:hypothetical protein